MELVRKALVVVKPAFSRRSFSGCHPPMTSMPWKVALPTLLYWRTVVKAGLRPAAVMNGAAQAALVLQTVTKSMKLSRLLLKTVADRLNSRHLKSKPASWPIFVIGCRLGLMAVKLVPLAKLRYIWFMPGAEKLRYTAPRRISSSVT